MDCCSTGDSQFILQLHLRPNVPHMYHSLVSLGPVVNTNTLYCYTVISILVLCCITVCVCTDLQSQRNAREKRCQPALFSLLNFQVTFFPGTNVWYFCGSAQKRKI